MKNKVFASFYEAVTDIPDGASIAIESWGIPGAAQNLIAALRRKGVKDLTLITHNFIPTIYSEEDALLPVVLLPQLKKLVTAVVGFPQMGAGAFIKEYVERGLEVELTSHGILSSRLYAGAAGLGGIYTPVGVGTILEEGKEKRVIDGRDYIFEEPIRPDYAFIVAHRADTMGNLVYLGIFRADQPVMAMAAKVTIVEAEEIVEVGEIDPEHVMTPSVFVDRIVEIPKTGYGTAKKRKELVYKLGEIEIVRKMLFNRTS
jgi:3-oxoacid CoA-transferase subunit A